MHLLAPAKLNLHLRVGPLRVDGFHPVLTWMVKIGLFDKLAIEPHSQPGASLRCDDPTVPTDERNLVIKAFNAAQADLARPGHVEQGVEIRLHKRIPAGAGLGGGSSDAAAMLLAMRELWQWKPPNHRLEEIAAGIGSDVGFFLHRGSAICRGRGERVEPIDPPKPKWAVLILPGRPMPTGPVYQRFDQMRLGRQENVENEPPWRAWTELGALELLPRLVNDLEPAAFDLDPELRRLRDAAEARLGRTVRMSGSGSSLYTLFDGEQEAVAAANDATAIGVKAKALLIVGGNALDHVA
jgi:4-diphosphocytidyl-2-C-methyl-D-erythritol kinase